MKVFQTIMASLLLCLFTLSVWAQEDADNVTPPTTPAYAQPQVLQKELQLVENLTKMRKQYAASLENLIEFYDGIGDYHKKEMAETELDSFLKMTKYDYIMPSKEAQRVVPSEHIPAAEYLYKEAMDYKNAFAPFDKKDKLNLALDKFKELIEQYPTSEKAEDAAYQIAEIYAGIHFQNYPLAAHYYERVFDWDPATKYRARMKAGVIYYKELKDYKNAARILREVLQYSDVKKDLRHAKKYLDEMEKYGFVRPEEE